MSHPVNYVLSEMSIMCRHLPDKRSGRLANFVRLAEFLADHVYKKKVCFTGIFMSDIRSGTNEKVAGPAKVLSGLSGSSCG